MSVKFQTKDINHAAFMWCQVGTTLDNVARKNPTARAVYFNFTLPLDEVGLQTLLLDYINGRTQVEPKLFAEKQSNLRDLLHGHLQRPNQ